MTELLLGPLLRHVTTSSATIWVETSARCSVVILGVSAATFTVEGHHYALAIVERLEPDTTYPYTVELDGVTVWPPAGYAFPPPAVRTLGRDRRRIMFGSCRAAAPHEPPYTLELDHDKRGRGVDALRAHGLRMLRSSPDEWPDLLVLLGDQVYADDPSPRTERRISLRRHRHDDAPDEIVADFEQYTWLYREAWIPDVERWVLSVVPSTMVFDDHDMIDDWNISQSWVDDIRQEPWWEEHVIGGLMSYWIYQHAGNLGPEQLISEGLLAELCGSTDGEATSRLRQWALESERATPVPGGYQFSYHRELGDVRLIVIDSRNGRVLDPQRRQMVDDAEWEWIRACATQPCRHLLLASSLPMLAPAALHDLQQWNEAVCAGRWGRAAAWVGERIRRALDLEDWAAFDRSFRAVCGLVAELSEPETVTLLAGDIHFAYVAQVALPESNGHARVRQVVTSPIRNALVKRDRRVIDFALTRPGRAIGRWLRRSAGRAKPELTWQISDGPIFDNNMGMITVDEGRATLQVERARPDDDGEAILELVVDVDL